MFFKKGMLKNSAKVNKKCLCWNLFLTKLWSSRPATLLKSNFSTDVFVNIAKFLEAPILENLCKRLLLKFNESVFLIMKYHSELIMKNIFHVLVQSINKILIDCSNTVALKLKNKKA